MHNRAELHRRRTLAAIQFSRRTGLPLLGTFGGCQYVVIEFARNVLGIGDAQHAEHDPYASKLLVTPLSCSLVGQRMEVLIEAETLAAAAYSATAAAEEYYCNFGLNPDYEAALEEGGLRIIGRDALGEPRILTLPQHPFFLATVFVPQLRSTQSPCGGFSQSGKRVSRRPKLSSLGVRPPCPRAVRWIEAAAVWAEAPRSFVG